jgi:hypothetical protein
MQYFLWNAKITGDDYSIFTIADNLEEARRSAIRNAPRACRQFVEEAVQNKPHTIKGPYSFLVKALVDFDCKEME